MSKPSSLTALSKKAKTLSSKRSIPTPGVALDGILHPSQSAGSSPSQPAQKIHWRSSRSMALMRQAVAAPKKLPLIKADIKRSSKTGGNRRQAKLVAKVDSAKQERASTVSRSSRISRFSNFSASLRPEQPVAKISAQVRAMSPMRSGSTLATSANTMAMVHPAPSLPGNISNQKLEAMLDRALQQADAHKQALSGSFKRNVGKRLRTPRALVVIAVAILAITAAIFYAYLRLPAFSVRVASLVSGVDAHTPNYIPPGYALSKTNFGSGDVTLIFTNKASSFSISQQKSGLNDTALQTSVAAPADKLYQASQYNGITVYTYSNAKGNGANNLNAALVNQGVKTTVSNNAGLDNDQLTKIVQGLL